jgi:hypothetical protein
MFWLDLVELTQALLVLRVVDLERVHIPEVPFLLDHGMSPFWILRPSSYSSRIAN